MFLGAEADFLLSSEDIADRTAAPLQKGNIDLISVPLNLNCCFIFLMVLMRVFKTI